MRCRFVALLSLGVLLTTASAQQPPSAANEDEKRFATLEGRLIDANTGEPVRKANLTLMQIPSPGVALTGPPPSTAAASDAEGKFSFTRLEPGTYMLSAEKVGYGRQQYGSRNAQFGPGTNLTLKAGEKLASLEFKLPRQAVIIGRVIDEDGDPVPQAMVSVLRQLPFGRQPQMMMGNGTNDLGEFRIANLGPGKYFIRAAKAGFFPQASPQPSPAEKGKPRLDYVPTFYPSVTDVNTASPIIVTAGQQVSGIDIQLRKGHTFQITGKLAGIRGEGRVQIAAQPQASSRGGGMMFSFGGSGTTPKADGSFTLASIQPGSYDIVAMSYDNGRPAVIGRTPVTVTSDNVENVVVNAGAVLSVAGHVVLEESDTPPAQSQPDSSRKFSGQVGISAPGRMSFFSPPARIGNDGTFKLEGVSREKVIFVVYGLPEGQYLKSVTVGSADITTSGLDLTSAETTPDIEIHVSTKGATVEGNVLDAEGKPAPGGVVMLLPEPYDPDNPLNTVLRKAASTDQSGHFSIKSMQPGSYRLYAWGSYIPFGDIEPQQLKPFEKNSKVVKLKESQTEQAELKIILIPE